MAEDHVKRGETKGVSGGGKTSSPASTKTAAKSKSASQPKPGTTNKGRAAAQGKPVAVDDSDVLAASTMAAVDWVVKRRVQFGIGALILAAAGAAGYAFWAYRVQREEQASGLVAKAISAEFAPLRSGHEDPEVLKRIAFYESEEQKQTAALARYAEARQKFGDTGPGILARLGEAGVRLDRREWDEAIAAYSEVRNSALATADASVRLRAIEGLGYAREGKGLLDDARRSFEELAGVDVRGAKPLGLYHQARIDVQKGDSKAAIEKLKTAREQVATPASGSQATPSGPSQRYLQEQIDKLLGRLDPTLVPKARPSGGMGSMTPEQIQRLLEQMKSQGGSTGAP